MVHFEEVLDFLEALGLDYDEKEIREHFQEIDNSGTNQLVRGGFEFFVRTCLEDILVTLFSS